MISRSKVPLALILSSAAIVSACKPAEKPADLQPTAEAAAPVDTTTPSAMPALFAGIAGADRVPAALLGQMATETAPHWARCGDEMVAAVVGADGKDQGFIVARNVSFTFVDAPIDVPSQQAGTTTRQGINLRSNSHVQYFGEGVSRTDISGRSITKAGWSGPVRLTAPLPHWRADEIKGAWTAIFRHNATDASEWTARYRAADCAAVPPGAPAGG
jgi:hypothetical protein